MVVSLWVITVVFLAVDCVAVGGDGLFCLEQTFVALFAISVELLVVWLLELYVLATS